MSIILNFVFRIAAGMSINIRPGGLQPMKMAKSQVHRSLNFVHIWGKEDQGVEVGGNLRSSHNGPSRVAQLKPWRMVSLTLFRSRLSTYR